MGGSLMVTLGWWGGSLLVAEAMGDLGRFQTCVGGTAGCMVVFVFPAMFSWKSGHYKEALSLGLACCLVSFATIWQMLYEAF
jgi:hypothetical protein